MTSDVDNILVRPTYYGPRDSLIANNLHSGATCNAISLYVIASCVLLGSIWGYASSGLSPTQHLANPRTVFSRTLNDRFVFVLDLCTT